MSFSKQTRWCWLWGLAMVPVLVMLVGGAALVAHHLAHMLQLLTLLILLEMLIFIGIGGMLRPASKVLYHRVLERSAPIRRLAGRPGLRHWFWLTPQGFDRDA